MPIHKNVINKKTEKLNRLILDANLNSKHLYYILLSQLKLILNIFRNYNWEIDFKCAYKSWASYPLVIQLLQDITAKIKIWYICTL